MKCIYHAYISHVSRYSLDQKKVSSRSRLGHSRVSSRSRLGQFGKRLGLGSSGFGLGLDAADMRFFRKILSNPCHVLASLIPPEKTHSYNLRTRRTNLQLPPPNSNSDKNFINRIIIGLNAP